jgi:hypothetical protein
MRYDGTEVEIPQLSRSRRTPTGSVHSGNARQGRITEIGDATERIRVIARSFVENPENTLVISPDNASRRQLNDVIRTELQSRRMVGAEDHWFRVLIPQQDMTSADRRWAARYNVDDVLRYSRGSKALGVRAGSYARVLSTNLPENLLTVETENRGQVTYDPRRLAGVSIHRESEQRFAVGTGCSSLHWTKELESPIANSAPSKTSHHEEILRFAWKTAGEWNWIRRKIDILIMVTR